MCARLELCHVYVIRVEPRHGWSLAVTEGQGGSRGKGLTPSTDTTASRFLVIASTETATAVGRDECDRQQQNATLVSTTQQTEMECPPVICIYLPSPAALKLYLGYKRG